MKKVKKTKNKKNQASTTVEKIIAFVTKCLESAPNYPVTPY